MDDLTLKPIPIVAAVQVLRYRVNSETNVLEPWPVCTCEIDQAGRIAWRGDAGKAYEPLLRATHKASAMLARQSVAEALADLHELQQEQEAGQ